MDTMDQIDARHADAIDTPLLDRFEQLPLAQLIESGHNPRTHFDPLKLADLAASIAQKGVVEPLVVRPLSMGYTRGEDAFEIVAGARRYRAAKLAGLARVPCVIRHYTDEDVLELTIIENIQRDDLDPLEEARGYRALLDANPARYSAAYIAERIGKSEKYVWDRMKLLDLVPLAQAHLEAGRINAGHGILLARLKHEDQLRALDVDKGGVFTREALLWDPREHADVDQDTGEERETQAPVKAVTVRELEKWIAEHVRFDIVQAANAAPLDFGPVAEAVDRALAQPGRGKKVIAITYEYHVKEDARDPGNRTYGAGTWKRADGREGSKTCGGALLGVIAVGPGYGEAFDVCIEKACDVHWKQERLERDRAATKRERASTTDEDRATAQHKQDEERARAAAAKEAWDKALPDILDALATRLKTAKPATIAELVLRGVDTSWNGTYMKQGLARFKKPKTAEDIVRVAAFTVLAQRASNWQGHLNFPKEAKAYGLDTRTFLAAAKTEKRPVQTSAVAKAATTKAARVKKAKRR